MLVSCLIFLCVSCFWGMCKASTGSSSAHFNCFLQWLTGLAFDFPMRLAVCAVLRLISRPYDKLYQVQNFYLSPSDLSHYLRQKPELPQEPTQVINTMKPELFFISEEHSPIGFPSEGSSPAVNSKEGRLLKKYKDIMQDMQEPQEEFSIIQLLPVSCSPQHYSPMLHHEVLEDCVEMNLSPTKFYRAVVMTTLAKDESPSPQRPYLGRIESVPTGESDSEAEDTNEQSDLRAPLLSKQEIMDESEGEEVVGSPVVSAGQTVVADSYAEDFEEESLSCQPSESSKEARPLEPSRVFDMVPTECRQSIPQSADILQDVEELKAADASELRSDPSCESGSVDYFTMFTELNRQTLELEDALIVPLTNQLAKSKENAGNSRRPPTAPIGKRVRTNGSRHSQELRPQRSRRHMSLASDPKPKPALKDQRCESLQPRRSKKLDPDDLKRAINSQRQGLIGLTYKTLKRRKTRQEIVQNAEEMLALQSRPGDFETEGTFCKLRQLLEAKQAFKRRQSSLENSPYKRSLVKRNSREETSPPSLVFLDDEYRRRQEEKLRSISSIYQPTMRRRTDL
jgi:hypothetical protein